MKHITLEEMLNCLVEEIIRSTGKSPRFFWKDGDGIYREVNVVDLMSNGFKADALYFSIYEWERDKSRIYINE